jgi:S1-C subfamily serine protease
VPNTPGWAGTRAYRAVAPLPLVLTVAVLVACSSSGANGTSTPGTRAGSGKTGTSARSSTSANTCIPVDDAIPRVEASVVRIETPPDAKGEVSAGTGFVIDSDVVLTNQHVVAGVVKVLTTFLNGRRAIGQVLSTNEAQDLALIQVDTATIPPVVWGDDRSLSKGTPLAAIGYAFDKRGPPTITTGSYLQTYVDPPTGQAYLLTDVKLDHGDSGGPLLNQCGQVIGVNTAKIRSQDRAGLSIPQFLAQCWATQQIQLQR